MLVLSAGAAQHPGGGSESSNTAGSGESSPCTEPPHEPPQPGATNCRKAERKPEAGTGDPNCRKADACWPQGGLTAALGGDGVAAPRDSSVGTGTGGGSCHGPHAWHPLPWPARMAPLPPSGSPGVSPPSSHLESPSPQPLSPLSVRRPSPLSGQRKRFVVASYIAASPTTTHTGMPSGKR